MKTFRMMKTDVQGQYVTDQIVITDPGDTVKFVYPDKDPVVVQFGSVSGSGYTQCPGCPLVTSNTASPIVCSSLRRTTIGLVLSMCYARGGSLYRIARVGDVMEEL